MDRHPVVGSHRRRRRRRLRRQPREPGHRVPHLLRHVTRAFDVVGRLRHRGPTSAPPSRPSRQPFYPPFEAAPRPVTRSRSAGDALYVSRDNGTLWIRCAAGEHGGAARCTSRTRTTCSSASATAGFSAPRWNGSAWPALTALDHAARGRDRQRPPRRPGQPEPHLGHAHDARRRTRLPLRRRRHDLDRLHGRSAEPADQRHRRSTREREPRLGRAGPGRVPEPDAGGDVGPTSPTGCPTASVGDLVFHPHARVLRAGTRNRGVWEIPVDGWMTGRDLRHAVHRQPRRQRDAALVHAFAGRRRGT